MKSRMIRPEFWTDGKVVQLSAFARLLFIACWQMADDAGRFEWEPTRIKLQVFPADAVDVVALGAELGALGLIRVYSANGKEYACIPKFADHQKLHADRESKFPAPPESWADLGQSGPVRAEIPPSRACAPTQPNPKPQTPNPKPQTQPLATQARRAKPSADLPILDKPGADALVDSEDAGAVLTPEQHAAIGLYALRAFSRRDFRQAPEILARCREGATWGQLVAVCDFFAQQVAERPEFWTVYFNATTPFRASKWDQNRAQAEAWEKSGKPWLSEEGRKRFEHDRKLSLGRPVSGDYAVAG